MALQWALCALGAALAVGEGGAWAALLLLAGCLWQNLPANRRLLPAKPLGALGGAAAGLALYGAAGAVAWPLGTYGLLRPQALAHLLPLLAWPLVACAAGRASERGRDRALATFGLAVAAAVLLGLLLGAAPLLRAEAWVRLDSWASEQNNVPSGLARAAGGLYFHRLKMAHVLLIGLGPLLGHVLMARVPLARLARAAGLLVLFTVALCLTFARAAYLGAAAGALTVLAVAAVSGAAPRRRLVALIVTALCCGALILALRPDVRQRALSTRSSGAAQVRAVIWSQATAILWDHPLGIGLGNYPQVVARYYAANDPLTKSPRTYPHNFLLMAWAEAGPLGALGFALFWMRLLCAGARALAYGPTPRHQQTGAALLFMVSAFVAVGLTHDVLFHNIVALAFFSALGLASAELTPKAKSP